MTDRSIPADEVADTADWIRRCHARLNALNPVLLHAELSRVSEDMSRRTHWRRMAPETAAEEALSPPETRQPRAEESVSQSSSDDTA